MYILTTKEILPHLLGSYCWEKAAIQLLVIYTHGEDQPQSAIQGTFY